jgi:hypothetical protein
MQFRLYTDLENILPKNVITQLEDFLFDKYKVNWQNRMFSQKVGNKLRTYKLFKEVFETEMYLSKNIPSRYRSAFAKFRCGVAPLRIETGRDENKNVNERVCFICHDQIEDEKHVLLDCPLYADLRESLFNEEVKGVMYIILFYVMMISLYINLKVLNVMIWLPRPALIF